MSSTSSTPGSSTVNDVQFRPRCARYGGSSSASGESRRRRFSAREMAFSLAIFARCADALHPTVILPSPICYTPGGLSKEQLATYKQEFSDRCSTWSSERVVDRDLFGRGESNPWLWPLKAWASVDDDAGRPYRIAEVDFGCVTPVVSPEGTKPSQHMHLMYEQGLVFNASTVFDSDGAFTTLLRAPTSGWRVERHASLGTMVQSAGEQAYHVIVETLPKAMALLAKAVEDT